MAWIRLQGSCMGFENGNPVYLIVQHDITDMKNLEAQLTEEKERYRIAYKNSKTLMFEYNIQSDKLFYFGREENDKGENVTIIENYIGSGILDSDTYPADRAVLIKFFKGEIDRNVKIRRNAQRFGYSGYEWVELTASTIYDEDKKPLKIIGNFQTIGEQDNSIYEKIETLIKENKDQKFAIIRMDIDNFKMINDLHGWKEGDKVLSFIANSLRDVVPDDKYPVGRITSDIFCVCMPYVDGTNVSTVINMIMASLKDYPVDLGLSAHFGVYVTDENSVNIPATIMFDRANLALKTVKDRVSPVFAYFDNNLRDTLLNEQMIEKDMHSALENGHFVPYYQPKYNISTGKVVGAEALVRWIHPEKGIIPPGSFIPLFERNGFIINVDEYIWEDVCRKMALWRDKGYQIVPVSVNVSRLHIFDPNFITKIKNLVAKYNIDPKMLILEFTESLLVENAEEMLKMMNELKNEGFNISMDDFGSGFSSLNMLKDMPLNEVKIDKEFLNETQSTNAAKGKTVVAGTILMVNQLDMGVIAEGVENHEQAQFLLAAGCETAQG
ncbi:MAG: EAL domain-containing protein, partial [Oscillospiraceae bacterium]|nr:EAL domain-containing protein [Oscillospiraceae bacterium]